MQRVLPRVVRGVQTAVLIFVTCLPLSVQGNYEVQVYGADTAAPGRTMVELHSNFTLKVSGKPSGVLETPQFGRRALAASSYPGTSDGEAVLEPGTPPEVS